MHAHHFAELLEPFHELLVGTVLGHGLLGVGLEQVDGLHVFWVGEQFVDFLIIGHLAQEVIRHPLRPSFVQIIVHFHGLLDFLELQRV